jgi:hypothetical protein
MLFVAAMEKKYYSEMHLTFMCMDGTLKPLKPS